MILPVSTVPIVILCSFSLRPDDVAGVHDPLRGGGYSEVGSQNAPKDFRRPRRALSRHCISKLNEKRLNVKEVGFGAKEVCSTNKPVQRWTMVRLRLYRAPNFFLE